MPNGRPEKRKIDGVDVIEIDREERGSGAQRSEKKIFDSFRICKNCGDEYTDVFRGSDGNPRCPNCSALVPEPSEGF